MTAKRPEIPLYWRMKWEERSSCLRLGNVFGLTMLLTIVIPKILNGGLSLIASFGPDAQETIYCFSNDSVMLNVLNLFFSLLCFLPPFLLAAKLAKTNTNALVSFEKTNPLSAGSGILMILACAILGGYLSSIVSRFIEISSGVVPYNPDFSTQPTWSGFAFNLLVTAAAPALIEEFAFRGIALSALRRIGNVPAILLSALLFGVMHGNLSQAPFAFVAGLGLGIAYVSTENFWVPVAGHFLVNAISCTVNFASDVFPQDIVVAVYVSYQLTILSMAALACLIRAFRKSPRAEHSASRPVYSFSAPKRIFMVLTSPAMLIYLCIITVRLVRNMVSA